MTDTQKKVLEVARELDTRDAVAVSKVTGIRVWEVEEILEHFRRHDVPVLRTDIERQRKWDEEFQRKHPEAVPRVAGEGERYCPRCGAVIPEEPTNFSPRGVCDLCRGFEGSPADEVGDLDGLD